MKYTPFEIEQLKQNMIVTINMINDVLSQQRPKFDYLYSLSVQDLESLQTAKIEEYNSFLNQKK